MGGEIHECVEVGFGVGAGVLVRDSKDPDGPRLAVDRGSWRSFVAMVTAA